MSTVFGKNEQRTHSRWTAVIAVFWGGILQRVDVPCTGEPTYTVIMKEMDFQLADEATKDPTSTLENLPALIAAATEVDTRYFKAKRGDGVWQRRN
jgi:hypothetical protein